VSVHVVWVEPTYMPKQLDFVIDAPAGNYPAGSILFWSIQAWSDSDS
jgi:hypothetical protein